MLPFKNEALVIPYMYEVLSLPLAINYSTISNLDAEIFTVDPKL